MESKAIAHTQLICYTYYTMWIVFVDHSENVF